MANGVTTTPCTVRGELKLTERMQPGDPPSGPSMPTKDMLDEVSMHSDSSGVSHSSAAMGEDQRERRGSGDREKQIASLKRQPPGRAAPLAGAVRSPPAVADPDALEAFACHWAGHSVDPSEPGA